MRTFQNWCALNSVSELPASPADVAQFVTDCGDLGMGALWPIIQDIARAHYLIGLADPTLGGPVSAAIKDVAKLTAPRSWLKDEWPCFYAMPYDLQLIVLRRETERDVAVRRAQNEATQARKELAAVQKELAAIQQPPKVIDGNTSHTTT